MLAQCGVIVGCTALSQYLLAVKHYFLRATRLIFYIMKPIGIITLSALGWIAAFALLIEQLNLISFAFNFVFFLGFLSLYFDKDFPHRLIGIISSFTGIILINLKHLIAYKVQSLITNSIPLAKIINIADLNYSVDLFFFFVAALWMIRLYGFIPIISLLMRFNMKKNNREDISKYPYKFWWIAPGICFFTAFFFFCRSFQ